jgi:single-strand DNA-binding protein
VTVWGEQAEHCSKYLSKGRSVYVEGRLQTRSWDDKEGKKRYSTDIVADRVVFLGGASGEGGGARRGGGGRSWGEEGAPQSQPSDPPEPMSGPGPGDDDIPF